MKQALISQYQAALKMLVNLIEQCPDELWTDTSYQSTYGQIVYHSLHFTALYISKNEDEFSPWPLHHYGSHHLGRSSQETYPKSDMLRYTAQISQSLGHKITRESLTEFSEFEWLPMNKIELHLYNLRHLQHHIGQLVERLHQKGISGIAWIASSGNID